MLLMEEAERIARQEHASSKMAVISGVGTRDYYRKMGYQLEGPYMVKDISAVGEFDRVVEQEEREAKREVEREVERRLEQEQPRLNEFKGFNNDADEIDDEMNNFDEYYDELMKSEVNQQQPQQVVVA